MSSTGSRDTASPGRDVRDDSPLSARENEVLEAIASGHTSRSAAEALGISERTIKAHLTSVFHKFGVDTRAAAIAFAAERGWLSGGKRYSLWQRLVRPNPASEMHREKLSPETKNRSPLQVKA